jgi:hypothetical protein
MDETPKQDALHFSRMYGVDFDDTDTILQALDHLLFCRPYIIKAVEMRKYGSDMQ